ncbi:peptidase inhibitor family I36 protein [Actinomadura sp. NPDC048032]|uniref:peptidase inhibitor family I36 protein n=1 Tax=Actinomadura sp. NPDC048032 TaxID=3155747 RepID=UPI0033D39296
MIKILKGLAIGLPFAAAALVVTPGTAHASLSDCPSSNFCAWANDGFTGRIAPWAGNSSNWATKNMHDDAESLFNNARSSSTVPDNVRVYLDINYGREDICVNPGETYDLAMNDNDYDSHLWVHSC